jgi:hypothetical protein
MLTNISHALQQLLWSLGQIDSQEVDVRFEAPTKDWIASLTRPTINLFLFDVQENTEKRETNMRTVRSNGIAERRLSPRRFDLRYMVSALSTEIEDEHELLWRVLSTLMKYQQLPPEVLPETLRSLEPPLTTRIGNREEGGNFLDIWSALGTPPHPALCYIVTAPLDLDIAIQAPIVLTRTARYGRTTGNDVLMETAIHIGGVVRSKEGRPLDGLNVKLDSSANNGSTTDDSGRYVLRVPGGPVSLSVLQHGKIQKRVKLRVPSESYDIVLDE